MSDASAPKTLYLIDGHAQFFRAYHAIRSGLTSPVTKEPTNLTFGFVGMLLKVLREYKPDYLAVVIDVSGDRETFRSEIYPEYKANREPPPDDFHPQVERCLKVLEQMQVPVLGEPGVEADDVIATIVRRMQREQPDLRVRIVSKDKDLTQLLSDHVELFDVHTDTGVTAADVFDTPGVEPRHVIDILTLMGDKVDNVPGVPGVGPKTAAQLMLQYGSIDNLLQHLGEIKGKRRENLEAAKDSLPLSRRLIVLKDDVEAPFELDRARVGAHTLPVDEMLATLRELGFNRYQDEVKALTGQASSGHSSDRAPLAASRPRPRKDETDVAEPPSGDAGLFAHLDHPVALVAAAPVDRGQYQCIRTLKELDAVIKDIRKAGEFAIDTETDGLQPVSANLCGACISVKPGTGVYIPVRSPEPKSHLTQQQVIERLRAVLEDPKLTKVGHNLKFDINVLRRAGARVRGGPGKLIDTMIASYVIDASRSSHKMDVLALALLNHTNIPISDLIGSGKTQRTFDQAPLDQATEYAAEDADITLRLREVMMPQLESTGLMKLFADLDMPLVEVLAELEWNGIRVDPDELDRQTRLLEKQVDGLRRKISDAAPFPFSPDSPKQLAVVLFNKPTQEPPGLGLKVIKRGKTGPSTDQEVLEKLAADPDITNDLPALIVEYRQLTKLVSTYLVALKEAINPVTGRVHAGFHQTVAATGRLSSSDPNLQNIPIRSDVGREIRRAFVADPGNVLLAADYSQIELRILAHLSEDPALIDAFLKGLDIHTAVAAEVFGVALQDVTSEQRNSAKMVNFGIIYGITAFGLARRLGSGTSNEQAAKIIADYKQRFSRIDAFLEQCIQQAQTQGYVETMLGRRRAIPQINDRNPHMRGLGERMAINSVVQGSAADLIKLAMIDLHRRLPQTFPKVKMLLQIHDELVFEVPQGEAEAAARFIVAAMEGAMKLKVPLKVEAAWSHNWIDAK